ncbi:LPS-assembly protein LptD [Simiduia agarivorans]|uniref:LPS-assembly protein LptD n=1 Tax=Simiduia agarivorans (strain DSM 21679 / JCM 13881 / BCRC 17597 / SA1) TaxID=1117647 RepID=K4KMJ6_SIMAS|nr:LPS-assembly protein LptD [Simiduia agarivorans]AFV00232.1 putative organic solvent tolerance protein [Simiduia agarivorans SA1 = DSM 21679]
MFKPYNKKPLVLALALASSGPLWAQEPYVTGPDGDMFSSEQRHRKGLDKLDWVPRSEMTEAQQSRCKLGCDGAYVEPDVAHPDASLRPDRAPVRASADESRWIQDDHALLTGNVEIIQGWRTLSADQARVKQADRQAEISGHVVLREPGLLVISDRLLVDESAGTASMESARFVMHGAHLRGEAGRLSHDQGGAGERDLFTLEDSRLTMCEPGNETWAIVGESIEIDGQAGQGVARHMKLEINEVPVFYAPYFRFPASDQRMTGLLFPAVGYGSRNGLDYEQPIYFNLAPNYDLTLIPRYLQHRGVSVGAEARHLNRYFETTLAGAYLGNDKGGENKSLQEQADAGEISQDEVQPYKGENRWMVALDQRGGAGQPWYTTIDYNEVSDVDYLRDLDSNSLDSATQSHLSQMVGAGYRFEHWQFGVKAQAYQSVVADRDEPYRMLPEVRFDGRYRFADYGSLQLNHQYTQFGHRYAYWDQEDDAPDDARILGSRLRTDYRLGWDQRWTWGFLRPALLLKHLQYDLDPDTLNADANATPSITGAQASLDGGLLFEREGDIFAHDYVQTFEPRLFYFNSPEQDHSDLYDASVTNRDVLFDTADLRFSYESLFRESRFSGGDRIDDADQLSVGLTTRFLQAGNGVERLRASIGQIFYFSDRLVSLTGTPDETPRSEIAGQLAAQIGDNWTYNLDLAYAEDGQQWTRGSTSLRHVGDSGTVVNMAYRYERKGMATDPETGELYDLTISQTDLGVVHPLNDKWNLFARSFYDLTLKRELETFAGVEYNSCCYRMRFLARQWTDSRDLRVVGPSNLELDRGIFFEFQLKGLGTLGRNLDRTLREGITGFDRRPQYEP